MLPLLRSPITSELQLLRLGLALGAMQAGGALSLEERQVAAEAMGANPPDPSLVEASRAAILAGQDPLGEELYRLRSPIRRRATGAFYTPEAMVRPMVEWVLAKRPARLVDAGCWTGRFTFAAVRLAPDLPIVAVDIDPVAELLIRAALAVLSARGVVVLQHSYTTLRLERIAGRKHSSEILPTCATMI